MKVLTTAEIERILYDLERADRFEGVRKRFVAEADINPVLAITSLGERLVRAQAFHELRIKLLKGIAQAGWKGTACLGGEEDTICAHILEFRSELIGDLIRGDWAANSTSPFSNVCLDYATQAKGQIVQLLPEL